MGKKNSTFDTMLHQAIDAIPVHDAPPELACAMHAQPRARKSAWHMPLAAALLSLILVATCSFVAYYRYFYQPGLGFVEMQRAQIYLLEDQVDIGKGELNAAIYTKQENANQLYLYFTGFYARNEETGRNISPRFELSVNNNSLHNLEHAYWEQDVWVMHVDATNFLRDALREDNTVRFTVTEKSSGESVDVVLADEQTLKGRTIKLPNVNGITALFTQLSQNSDIYALQFTRKDWDITPMEQAAARVSVSQCWLWYQKDHPRYPGWGRISHNLATMYTVMACYADGTALPCKNLSAYGQTRIDRREDGVKYMTDAMLFTLPEERDDAPVSFYLTDVQIHTSYKSLSGREKGCPTGQLPFPEKDGQFLFTDDYIVFDEYGLQCRLRAVERVGDEVYFYLPMLDASPRSVGWYCTGDLPEYAAFANMTLKVIYSTLTPDTGYSMSSGQLPTEIAGNDHNDYYIINYTFDPSHLPQITEPIDGLYHVPVRILGMQYSVPLDLEIPLN